MLASRVLSSLFFLIYFLITAPLIELRITPLSSLSELLALSNAEREGRRLSAGEWERDLERLRVFVRGEREREDDAERSRLFFLAFFLLSRSLRCVFFLLFLDFFDFLLRFRLSCELSLLSLSKKLSSLLLLSLALDERSRLRLLSLFFSFLLLERSAERERDRERRFVSLRGEREREDWRV